MKVLKGILIGIVSLIILIGGAIAIKYFIFTDDGSNEVVTVEQHGDLVSTKRDMYNGWKHQSVEDKIGYIQSLSTDTISMYLCRSLFNQEYYSIQLPNNHSYFMPNSSVILSDDGAIEVRLCENDSVADLKINTPKNYDSKTKYTNGESKKVHTVVKQLDDEYTVYANVYSNSEDWTTILNGIIAVKDYQEPDKLILTELDVMPSLSFDDNYIYTCNPETKELDEMQPAGFQDGFLYCYNSFYDIGQNVRVLTSYMYSVANNNVSRYVDRNREFAYIESDNGYFGIIKRYNNQCSYIMYGYGEEAKANIFRNL